ncbi:hypothetical protein A2U01_0091592, partial [Trifolium medium]|nr:hypothetical protein [Trifolium medium]
MLNMPMAQRAGVVGARRGFAN